MSILKKCKRCLNHKEHKEFNLRKDSKDGLSYWCKDCINSHYEFKKTEISENNKKKYLDNREAVNAKRRERRLANIEIVRAKEKEIRTLKKESIAANAKKWRESNKEHFTAWRRDNYAKNKKSIQERRKIKRSTDIFYKISSNMRARLWHAVKVKRWNKTSAFIEYIGCSQAELLSHIQSKFSFGMTWENYGEWHIDHITPLSSATTEQELYRLCHYSNLQPLWASDNIRKGASNGT